MRVDYSCTSDSSATAAPPVAAAASLAPQRVRRVAPVLALVCLVHSYVLRPSTTLQSLVQKLYSNRKSLSILSKKPGGCVFSTILFLQCLGYTVFVNRSDTKTGLYRTRLFTYIHTASNLIIVRNQKNCCRSSKFDMQCTKLKEQFIGCEL